MPQQPDVPRPADSARGAWALRLGRNALLWVVPVFLVWTLLTPFYNRFVTVAAGNLLHLVESPNVSKLLKADDHYISVQREDFPPSKGNLYRIRVTDIHYPLILLAVLFLGMPGLPLKQKLSHLGQAAMLLAFFHILDLFLWVKFVYATQLGEWTQQNYGDFGQNFWGMAKHTADLPIKLALPLVLWLAFYWRQLVPARP